MGYRYIEGLTVADVAFEATGKDFSELCESAAKAVTNAMIENPSSIKEKESKLVVVSADDEEKLLHELLDEIIFLKDAENMAFNSFSAKLEKKDKLILTVEMKGEEIDQKKHNIIVDVKAVSWHKYEVKKNGEWKAVVILDV